MNDLLWIDPRLNSFAAGCLRVAAGQEEIARALASVAARARCAAAPSQGFGWLPARVDDISTCFAPASGEFI